MWVGLADCSSADPSISLADFCLRPDVWKVAKGMDVCVCGCVYGWAGGCVCVCITLTLTLGGAPNTPCVTREATGAWRGQNTAIDAASLWEHDREKGLSGVGADTKKTGSRSRTNGAEVRLGGL